MGFFSRKKKEKETEINEAERLDEVTREDISKAYDELMKGNPTPEGESEPEINPEAEPKIKQDFENEVFKAKLNKFKEDKSQETFTEIVQMLMGRNFLLPSISNVKEPLEKVNGKVRVKPGVILNPVMLSAKDKTMFLPLFTDEKAMTQKSPSGINLQYKFEQCLGIVYNEKNPAKAIVINPFTENFILGEELLKKVFVKVDKAKEEAGNK